MQSYLANMRVLLARHHLLGLFVIAVVYAPLFTARAGGAELASAGGAAAGAPVAQRDNAAEDSRGPTIQLCYGNDLSRQNPISSFTYFVPLISLTLVDRQTSINNDEKVTIISYERKIGARSFFVACEFEIRGTGFHKNLFDPTGVIASRTADLKANESLVRALDYIKFEGEGFGRIEVEGIINGLTEAVTGVNLQFNARGGKSPVTIGLYDIKPEDGQYKYENRSNEVVARVNTLTFKKSDKSPRMGISVASVARAEALDGYFARVKGTIATLLMKPPKIDALGNETMLNFGYAILKQEPEFTFPTAKNLKEDRAVATLTLEP